MEQLTPLINVLTVNASARCEEEPTLDHMRPPELFA